MFRIKVIQEILDKIKGETYLEIGVNIGNTFSKINCKTKIAVDPISPVKKIRKILNDNTKYIKMTSDDFFVNHKDIFNTNKIDVAYIDGLHEYKQSLKDVENTLKYLNDEGIIIMHDCNPPYKVNALYGPTIKKAKKNAKKLKLKWSGFWNGDVWKTIVHLRSLRSDINIFVIDCDWGLGIITKKKAKNMLDYSIEDIEKMTYEELDNNRIKLLNLKNAEFFTEFVNRLN